MSASIQFKDVNFTWGTQFNLRLHQVFKPSVITCILGPSGSGKSSILRLASGLLRPNGGQVSLYLDAPTKAGSPFSMAFQDATLYPHLSLADNAVLPFQCTTGQRDEREQNVHRLGRLLGIDRILSRRPMHVSGGERQRAAVLKVLVSGAPVWLFDEPLSNLDSLSRYKIRSIIVEEQQKRLSTVLWVTHDVVDALAVAEDILIIRDGNAVQAGPAKELLANPESIDTARYLSNPPGNELAAEIRVESNSITVEFLCSSKPPINVDLPLKMRTSLEEKVTPVIAFIYPSSIYVNTPTSHSSNLHLRGELRLREKSIDRDLVECITPLGTIRAYAPPDIVTMLTFGAEVNLYLPLTKFLFFDSRTGRRISR